MWDMILVWVAVGFGSIGILAAVVTMIGTSARAPKPVDPSAPTKPRIPVIAHHPHADLDPTHLDLGRQKRWEVDDAVRR